MAKTETEKAVKLLPVFGSNGEELSPEKAQEIKKEFLSSEVLQAQYQRRIGGNGPKVGVTYSILGIAMQAVEGKEYPTLLAEGDNGDKINLWLSQIVLGMRKHQDQKDFKKDNGIIVGQVKENGELVDLSTPKKIGEFGERLYQGEINVLKCTESEDVQYAALQPIAPEEKHLYPSTQNYKTTLAEKTVYYWEVV